MKIGRFTASRREASRDAGRFTADRIDAADVEVAGTIGAAGAACAFRYRRRASRFRIMRARPVRCGGSIAAAAADIYRFALEHFAAVTAKSVVAPTVPGK